VDFVDTNQTYFILATRFNELSVWLFEGMLTAEKSADVTAAPPPAQTPDKKGPGQRGLRQRNPDGADNDKLA
jgi:hypothetical protein